MYYNAYSYYAYLPHYPMWVMADHSSLAQFSNQLAMPTNNSPFPHVDTHQLKASAKSVQSIMKQSQLLTNKIADSDQFAHDLMSAAQLSNKTEVDRLIASTGITIKFDTKFTPDGIQIRFSEQACCGLTLILDW